MPKNTEAVLKKYKKILVPELNAGQLCWLLRAKYLAPAEGLNKIQGKPFLVSEIEAGIESALGVTTRNRIHSARPTVADEAVLSGG